MVLENPSLVVEELDKRRGTSMRLSLEAEEILLKSKLRQLESEEQRYIRLYRHKRVDDRLLFTEIDRVKQSKAELEAELDTLEKKRQSWEENEARLDKIPDVVARIADKLKNADYDTRRLALEALDVKVVAYPGGNIHLNGSIPTEVQLSSVFPCQ